MNWRAVAVLVLAATAITGCANESGTGAPSTPPAGPTTTATQSAAATPAATPEPSGPCRRAADGSAGYIRLTCSVAAPALANNMLGDPATLKSAVLLPADYDATTTAYPVVYILAGWGDSGDSVASDMLRNLGPASSGRKLILVFTDGTNSLGGSFYANSSVTGNWADAVATDLVDFVDANFRTVPKATARGIAGHSMGGAGAINIGISRPDRFGAIFALSAGLFDADGFDDRFGDTGDPMTIQTVLDIGDRLAALPAADRGKGLVDQASGKRSDIKFALGYGAAFAPNPGAPLLLDWPFKLAGGKAARDQAALASWEAGFGNLAAKINAHAATLKALKGFGVEYGTREEQPFIKNGGHYFAGLLANAGVKVTEHAFEGGHADHLGDRMANGMLPFMEATLAA